MARRRGGQPRAATGSADPLTVGRVLAPWGLKGEVKVEVLTDFPQRFTPGQRVYIQGRALDVERSRPHKGKLVVKFTAVDSVEAAQELRGRFLEIPRSEAWPLPPGAYYHFELIGLEVWTTQGEPVGKIADILATGSNDVYVVKCPAGEVLIPAIEDVVKAVEPGQGRVIIEAIEGLLEK